MERWFFYLASVFEFIGAYRKWYEKSGQTKDGDPPPPPPELPPKRPQ